MKRPATKRSHLILLAIVAALGSSYGGRPDALDYSWVLNNEVVEPGKLIRSAQPQPSDLDRIKAEESLGTILCLRGHETGEVKAWAKTNGVHLLCLDMKAELPPTSDQIGLYFDILNGYPIQLDHYQGTILDTSAIESDSVTFPLPLLIHCRRGADRAGIMVALYRIAFQGWTLDQAKVDMMRHFHLPFSHPAQFKFLESVARELHPEYGSRRTTKQNRQEAQELGPPNPTPTGGN